MHLKRTHRHPTRWFALVLLLVAESLRGHAPTGITAPNGTDGLPTLLGAGLVAVVWLAWLRGARHVPTPRPARIAFHVAMLLGAFTVFGPLDARAETNSAWHMVQHMLLIVVVAPLGAIASPLPQLRAAAPRRSRPLWDAIAACGSRPLAMTGLHAVAIWVWHAPGPYLLALDNPWWHWSEHASFLVTGWLFWWAALHAPPARLGASLLALLLTLIHTGMLGALLSFARAPLYGEPDVTNQQLAGLVMWVPAGVFYVLAAARLVAGSLAAARPPERSSSPARARSR